MNKFLAQLGLALATYAPVLAFVFFTLVNASPEGRSEIFGSGFFGYLATFMTFWGWVFYLPALAISIRGIIKKDRPAINLITLACSIGWIAAGYWVMTHFA